MGDFEDIEIVEDSGTGGEMPVPVRPGKANGTIRGCSYEKRRGVFYWTVNGVPWQWHERPVRAIYRRGVAAAGDPGHLCCFDDAVLYSLGFEQSQLKGRMDVQ